MILSIHPNCSNKLVGLPLFQDEHLVVNQLEGISASLYEYRIEISRLKRPMGRSQIFVGPSLKQFGLGYQPTKDSKIY